MGRYVSPKSSHGYCAHCVGSITFPSFPFCFSDFSLGLYEYMYIQSHLMNINIDDV